MRIAALCLLLQPGEGVGLDRLCSMGYSRGARTGRLASVGQSFSQGLLS